MYYLFDKIVVNNYLFNARKPLYGNSWNSRYILPKYSIKRQRKDCQYPILNDILYINKTFLCLVNRRDHFVFSVVDLIKGPVIYFYLLSNTGTSNSVEKLFLRKFSHSSFNNTSCILRLMSVTKVFHSEKFSSELAKLVPFPYSRGRCTRYSDKLHDFSVTVPRCYKDVYINSFFPWTASLWNSLPID